MTRLSFVPLAVLAAAVPAAALAQTASPAPQPVTRVMMSTKLNADYADLDRDKDGKVTRAEIEKRITTDTAADLAEVAKRRAESFTKLDANKDGSVTRAEFEAAVPLPKVPPVDTAPVLARFDANKDGVITAAEFSGPTLTNFDALDTNKDGTISVAEQQQARSAQAAGR